MKRLLAIALAALMLGGCGAKTVAEVTTVPTEEKTPVVLTAADTAEQEFASRFDSVTEIALSDEGITVNGGEETEAVFTSRDIIYYEDRETYDSGNPYGEGEAHQRHTAEEAQKHLVVNITAPGAYRVTGKLTAGQIRVDLGMDAYEDPEAVVELILCDAEITCTVAPAILFLNTYECDGNWSVDEAKAEVDTAAAGANLILEGENTVIGSHVARIYKDKEGEKKLWKQDGAIYSYMSMNVFGPGSLELTADNEGMDTELHLTIHGGKIRIFSDNDGINTNEDGVSVTTINGGELWIVAGLGAEGDGIDSNGFLVINGGIVSAWANPAADAGLDSDMGSYIHGGTVVALGSTMDWAESDSEQVTMNLQFAKQQKAGSAVVVTAEDGTVVFAFDPAQQDLYNRSFQGAILSSPNLKQGETYQVYTGGTLDGEAAEGGIVDVTTVASYTGGTQMQYTGSQVGPGGFGGIRPEGGMTPPEGFDGEMPQMPEGFAGELPEGMEPGQLPDGGFGGRGGQRPEDGENMERPEGMEEPPEGFDGEMPTMPEGMERPQRPEGETIPEGGGFEGGFGGQGDMESQAAEASTDFYMSDKVNAFAGVTEVQ